MDKGQKLVTVTLDDIDWDSLKNLSEDAQMTAKALSFHFPSFIRKFENGVAQVSWQLNPDGRYYMDEDGYGMTDDEELRSMDSLTQKDKVVVKFQEHQRVLWRIGARCAKRRKASLKSDF